MTSTQDDGGRHTTRVKEEKCRFVGEVDLPESERDDSVLPPQPHSSRVSRFGTTTGRVKTPICALSNSIPRCQPIDHTCFVAFSHSADRYGECTSKPKHPSGVRKRSTWLMISTTGTNVLMTTSASSYRASWPFL